MTARKYGGELDEELHGLLALPGWCAYEKMRLLAQVICERDVDVSVEIGVYGGRSLLPQALAHRKFTDGIAIGIDPWDPREAQQYNAAMQSQMWALNEQAKVTDFNLLHEKVCSEIERLGLLRHAILIRSPSRDAAEMDIVNESVGLLHIDGNHSTEVVMDDIIRWLPKVQPGGIVWFDDTEWDTVKPAVDYALMYCSLTADITYPNNAIMEKR